MGITYKLTLAPITSEGITGHLQSINVQAQLTPLRTPARANLRRVEDFVTAFSEVLPNEQAKNALERLERGEIVVIDEPIPRGPLVDGLRLYLSGHQPFDGLPRCSSHQTGS